MTFDQTELKKEFSFHKNLLFFTIKTIFIFYCIFVYFHSADAKLGGFNLTETDTFLYDAAVGTADKTAAQIQVDEIKRLGGKHVVLNVKAKMITGRSNELIFATPPSERSSETQRMYRLVQYIHQQGLTVGIRPIFFVVGPNNEFPYYENQSDGSKRLWWHGNIQPDNPNLWFESFRYFLDRYVNIAKLSAADEFTIGAELYSMTVGLEDQWQAYPYGFPGRWLEILRSVKKKLPKARVMYDINFTDDKVRADNLDRFGGELERWRYRIVDLANRENLEEKKIWQDLVSFWQELDAIGIDMYRSLASKEEIIPTDYHLLVELLFKRASIYGDQIDNVLTEIAMVTQIEKKVYFKEIGYRSVEKGFIDPFTYDNPFGEVNLPHQAAAYKAFFQAFWAAGWPWFEGVYFWDISVDPRRGGQNDNGFTPLRKKITEDTILSYFIQ